MNSHKGMTLTELLVVIAIVGVLAGIVIPIISGVRSSARKTQCLSNMRETARAVLLYAGENKGKCPALYLGSAYGDLGPWSRRLVELGYISAPPYVFTCPDDETALAVTASAATATTPYNKKNTGRSYAYAIPVMQPVSGDDNRHVPLVLGTVARPAQVFMLVEFWQSVGQDYRQIAGSLAGRDSSLVNSTSGPHKGRKHCAYLDGHVASLSREEAAEQQHWSAQ